MAGVTITGPLHPSLPVFLGLRSPNEEQMGSCERLCQESNSTCAIARTHGVCVGGASEGELRSHKLFSRGNSLSQPFKRPSPRHGTFGTFGRKDRRSPRHHLLSVLWDHAHAVEKAFATLSEQPLPTFVLAFSTQHPSLCVQAL